MENTIASPVPVMGNGLWTAQPSNSYGTPSLPVLSESFPAPSPSDSPCAVAWEDITGRRVSEVSARRGKRRGRGSHPYGRRQEQIPQSDAESDSSYRSPVPANPPALNNWMDLAPYEEGKIWKTGCTCVNTKTGDVFTYKHRRDAMRHIVGPKHRLDPFECPYKCGYITPSRNRMDVMKKHMDNPKCRRGRGLPVPPRKKKGESKNTSQPRR